MYIILTGKHPIHETNDTKQRYLEKIKTAEWKFPPEFSELAKRLFLKLVKVEPLERYTAKQALQHPWVTRTLGTFPLSYDENLAYEISKTNLINVLIL